MAYNCLSRALAVWDKKDRELYSEITAQGPNVNRNDLEDMIYGGFVVSEQTDEIAEVQQQYRAGRFYTGSLSMTVVPTMRCNFACDYCYQGTKKQRESMSERVQDALLVHIGSSINSLRDLHIAWYGGEPLLEKEIIYRLSDRIIPLCDRAGVSFTATLVTNGWGLQPEVVDELNKRHVTTVQVTLDGAEKYHDSRRHLLSGKPTYSRIVQNLGRLVGSSHSHPIRLLIRVNVDVRNQEGIWGLVDHLSANGITRNGNRHGTDVQLYFSPVHAITADCRSCASFTLDKSVYVQREVDYYRYAIKKGLSALPSPPRFLGRCMAVTPNSWVVLPSGDLHKCWETISASESRIGTIFETEKVWSDANYMRWIEWSPFRNEVRRQCTVLPNCAGHCGYKSLYRDRIEGDTARVPCPSWKYSIEEHLLLRATELGFVPAKREENRSVARAK